MANNIYKDKNTKWIFLAVLFLLAFLERTVIDLGPNVELVTMAMILAAFYIGKKESIWLTLCIMILSDVVIGNSGIFIFTWSGFLIPAMLSSELIRSLKFKFRPVSLISTGITANLFFFFWTNFGVWLLGNMYSKDLAGLFMSYLNGVPFLKYQLVSTLLFIPLGYLLTETVLNFSRKWQLNDFRKSRLTTGYKIN